ncbi:Aste57867_13307 [Aphanomyces stellatus]|uniref:Aste57867_13307 protein n=1 Tax=Aphanomyces stellatus TaxID=120398 RepID=A0A485KXT5_9STRA|nr:hypothetical protein As57867_013258 [Aphanomyces stellatus]VFT90146.1 Aste57867_13307 [Aphanomyces stellatus]
MAGVVRSCRLGFLRAAARPAALMHVRRAFHSLPSIPMHASSMPLRRMAFSTDVPAASADATLSDADFARLSEETLNEILEAMDGIEAILPDADITLSQGVLTVNLGEDGTWVLNKQGPNKQIWWSSPISGPKRFEYDARLKKWFNTREKDQELVELLSIEIEELTGIIVVTE